MKRTLIALLAVLALGVSLMAKDLTFTGCTSDSKIVEISISLDDQASAGVEAHVREAFVAAAKGLTADAFVGRDGFLAFVSGLSDADKDAILGLSGPPEIVAGTCK